jgi:hypothetical protein
MNRALSPVWLLFILTGLNLFNYLDRSVGSAVLIPIQTEFQVNDRALGKLNTSHDRLFLLRRRLRGDRVSRKWLIAAAFWCEFGHVLTGFARVLGGYCSIGSWSGRRGQLCDDWPQLDLGCFPKETQCRADRLYVAIPVGSTLL